MSEHVNRPYEILSSINLETLAYKVNAYVAAGYVPQGGVIVHNSGSKVIEYHQAVFKTPQEPKSFAESRGGRPPAKG